MDERAARQAVKKFIEDNKTTWLAGIEHQGMPRDISFVAISRFTPPVGGYHICVHCSGYSVEEDNTDNGIPTQTTVDFPIVIDMADFMLNQEGDVGLYDKMAMDFIIIRDRLVLDLVKAANDRTALVCPITGTSFTIIIPASGGNVVSVENSETFVDDDVPVMISNISFALFTCQAIPRSARV
jgi:hypothetical protein